jgi:hypothetical protein
MLSGLFLYPQSVRDKLSSRPATGTEPANHAGASGGLRRDDFDFDQPILDHESGVAG